MASSSITLTAGMRKNLFSLQNTNNLMERTQKRMATGLRVQSAVDDPVNYFTALSHRQRAVDLSSRKDEMSESIQLVSAANEGVESITSLIASAKSLAQSALSAGTEDEVKTLEGQYNEVLSQIDQLVTDSGYKGVNLLGGSDVTHEVKFNEDGSSTLTMNGFDASTAAAGLNITASEPTYVEEATATITSGTGDSAVTLTADAAGTDGNGISLTVVQGTGASVAFGVAVVGDAITVTLGTDGTSAAVARTATYVSDAINANTDVQALGVSASAGGTGLGDVAVATAVTTVGGADASGDGWWSTTDGATDKAAIGASITQLDAARTTLRSESQKLSTNLSTITIRQEFTTGMINTLEDGAAELTNADMNEEGANMLMLQTRQSLGTTSLSMASQAAQAVLRLF